MQPDAAKRAPSAIGGGRPLRRPPRVGELIGGRPGPGSQTRLRFDVGSAYGVANLAQRWRTYADTGHGGNELLMDLDPAHFTFSILDLVAVTDSETDVIALEASWKIRLSTRAPDGLNANPTSTSWPPILASPSR